MLLISRLIPPPSYGYHPTEPPHILKAKQAAAEQGLDLVADFTALNLAAQFYRERPPAAAPEEELAKLRRILRNARQRYRQLKEILAAEDIPEAKKLKKIRFMVNLLLPEKEQDYKKPRPRSGLFCVLGYPLKDYIARNQKVLVQLCQNNT